MGSQGEKKAKKFLKKQGYKIVETNYRCSLGELDLVVSLGEYIVFVEVKTRTKQNPMIQITKRKIQKIRTLAMFYLAEKQISHLQPRFDVIGITKNGTEMTIEHIENAF